MKPETLSSVRVCHQTIEFGEIAIHVRTLRDKQQFSDPEGIAESLGINSTLWPLFGVVRPSSLVMSHFLLDYNFQGERILEAGCGIGLSSLLLDHLSADITATDYHPEAEGFHDTTPWPRGALRPAFHVLGNVRVCLTRGCS